METFGNIDYLKTSDFSKYTSFENIQIVFSIDYSSYRLDSTTDLRLSISGNTFLEFADIMDFHLSAFTMLILLGAAAQSHPSIGRSFYIPKYNLLGEDLFGGYNFFKRIPDKCIKTQKLNVNYDADAYFSNTKSFYNSLSTQSSLSVELQSDFTMGRTLDATTKSISGNTRTVSGVTLDIHAARSMDYLEATCAHDLVLNNNVRRSFEQLPRKINKPWKKSSWFKYKLFLETYGSHVVKQVVYGSSIYQHCFAESSKDYTKREFSVKACVQLEGPTQVGKLGVKACGNISQEEIQSVQSLATSSLLILRGGSAKTRAKLDKYRTKDLIVKFLFEANKTHQPIRYKYIAVWTLLQTKYIGTEHFDKAINLEYFYKGFLNYGCNYQVDKKFVLQKFIRVPQKKSKHPEYECILAPEGCHSDKDCHYRAPFWCECRGDSCVRYIEEKLDTGNKKVVAKIYRGSNWGWPGCTTGFFSCSCTNPKTHWKVVWGPSADEMQFKIALHERMKNLLMTQEKKPAEQATTSTSMDLDYY